MMTQIQDAIKVVDEFSALSTGSVFGQISKVQFIKELKECICHPGSIVQSKNGTCGAAVLCKYVAEVNPVLFANMAIGLYTEGKFRNNGLKLIVTEAMMRGTSTDLHFKGYNRMFSVDAILQGAITNKNNWILKMNPFKGESGLSTFMYPWFIPRFIKQFVGTAFCKVVCWPTNSTLEVINYNRFFVIAMVHLGKDELFSTSLLSNHYVQIIGCSEGKVSYWSWGRACSYDATKGFGNGIHQLFILKKSDEK